MSTKILAEMIEAENAEYHVMPQPATLALRYAGKMTAQEQLDSQWIVVDKDGKTIKTARRSECIDFCKARNFKFDAVGVCEKE